MNDEKSYEIVERLARIEAMLQSNMELLHSKASKSDLRALEERLKVQDERIDKIESDKVWLQRAIYLIIISAVMGLVMVGK